MKVVVLLSKTFFPQHFRAGESTYFGQKILAEQLGKPGITIVENGKEKVVKGWKKHTCRKNYQYWKDKIDNLREKGGVLSVRQWIRQPYKPPGQEVMVDIPADVVGVQKLELNQQGEWSAKIDGYNVPVALLAENDGLTEEEFKAWFAPVFKQEKSEGLDFAIIHFTKERY